MAESSAPLLPAKAAAAAVNSISHRNEMKKRRYGLAAFISVTCIGSAAVVMASAASKTNGLRAARKETTESSALSKTDTAEAESFQRVFSTVTTMADSVTISCSDVDFAYCGSATCTALSETAAACGCYVEKAQTGQFSFSTESLILIKSPLYRSAVLALSNGDLDETDFCSSLRDGSIFTTAGFNNGFGSFFLPTADSSTDQSSSLEITEQEPSASTTTTKVTRASCMGAPCEMYAWGDGCEATCVCPIYKVSLESDVQAKLTTSSSGDDGCFHNTKSEQSTDMPWTKDLDTLIYYVNRIKEALPNLADSLGTDNSCMGTCSIEPKPIRL